MTLVGSKVYILFFLDLNGLAHTPDMLFRRLCLSHCQK